MDRSLQRFVAILLLGKVVELTIRGSPLPLGALMVVGSLMLLVGLYPRVGAGTFAIAATVLPWLSAWTLWNNHLWLAAIIAGLIALDAPRWLFLANVTIVYTFAALAKLNVAFLSGWVTASAFSIAPLGRPLIDLGLAVPLSIGTVVVEAFVAAGLWFSPTRSLAMLAGAGIHLGMIVFMSESGLAVIQFIVFGSLMVAAYPLFLPRNEIHVMWDDACSFCGAWVRVFQGLDWFGVLRPIPLSDPARYGKLEIDPVEAAAALQVHDGRNTYSGYQAIRRVAAALPLTAPLAPILWSLSWAGNPIYRRVAARRTCNVAPLTEQL